MTKRDRFKVEMNALLKKYNVEICAREGCSGYECFAEGVTFSFDYDHDEFKRNGDGIIKDIDCGRFVDQIDDHE